MLPDVGPRRVRTVGIAALGVYGRNDYSFLPATRETNIGTVNQAARLTVYYDGREESATRPGSAPSRRTAHRKFAHPLHPVGFPNGRARSFDVLGQYFLSELERDPGGDTFDEGQTFGVGGFYNTAATIWARVVSSALKGSHILEHHHAKWGVKHRIESFDDVVSEWNVVDGGVLRPAPRRQFGLPRPRRPPQPDHRPALLRVRTQLGVGPPQHRVCARHVDAGIRTGRLAGSCRRPGSSVVGVDAP